MKRPPSRVLVGKVAPIPDAFKQHVFQNVYVSRRTYTPRHPVQDWERENSWAINAAGMSLIILVRWKEGKEEGSLRHRDFSSTPIPWTTTSFINVSSVVFFPRFFFSLFLCFSFTFFLFSVRDISFLNYLPDLQNLFNNMTTQRLWSIDAFPFSRVQFWGISTPITIARRERDMRFFL